MTEKNETDSAQIKALRKTDLSPFILMSNLMVPRLLEVFLPKLNEKQRKAFDKAMPVGHGKKIYVHLQGTPTPPIVIEMAQPIKMTIMSESEIKQEQIKGLNLTLEDVQVLLEKKVGKILWQIKGQLGTLLGLSGVLIPFIQLGPTEIKDIQQKAQAHFKPLFDLMPH